MSEVQAPAAAPVAEAAPAAAAPVQAAIQDAKQAVAEATTPQEKAIAEKRLEKYQLKLGGKTKEVELDLNDRNAVTAYLQKAEMFNSKSQESADLRKGLEQFVDLIRKDPSRVLSHPDINVDLKKFAQEIISRDLQEQQKSPEQREKERLEIELKELRDHYENDKKQKEQEEFSRLQSEQEEKITNDVMAALESVKLPKNNRAVRYMAEYMALALENGIDVSANDVAPLVKTKMREEYAELLRSSPDDLLEQFIDKDMETRLQKRRVAKLKAAPPAPISQVKPTGSSNKKPEANGNIKKKTITDFLNDS